MLLGSGPAVAIGPVFKLEDMQVSKTDCGGETSKLTDGVCLLPVLVLLVVLSVATFAGSAHLRPNQTASHALTMFVSQAYTALQQLCPVHCPSCSRPTPSSLATSTAAPCKNNQAAHNGTAALFCMPCVLLHANVSCCGFLAAGISTVGGVKFSGAAEKAACLAVSAQANNPSNKPLRVQHCDQRCINPSNIAPRSTGCT